MEYKPSEKRYETMQYSHCGNSGLKLPKISLGLWHNFGTNASMENMKDMCHTAFDLGVTHFDLANNYGPKPGSAEENFGKIMASDFASHRDELIISTKAGYTMWEGPYGDFGSRKYLLASLDQSLKRMQLPYVDIFYHHRMDPQTPLEETMSALDTAVKSGRALYAGLSNYDGETMKKATEILKDMKCPYIINQNKYSIFDRTIEHNGLKSACEETKKGIIAFSPLAQGLLTNRYSNGIPADSRVAIDGNFLTAEKVAEMSLKVSALSDIAKMRGETLAQMALAWVMASKEITSVLIGASKPQQIKENCEIINSAPFTKEELDMIDKICE